ncbi:MAG: glycoside hydrolase, partial [Actinobacteria bacterium]|nr:glycoside hydrolase [Actinomycetota bacterium]
CGVTDHENIYTAPPTRSVTAGYPRVVYFCATQGGIGTASKSNLCLKSLDGGMSFVPTGTPPYPPAGDGADGGLGQGMGGPDGTIYVPKGFDGLPYLAISTDEGLTWRRHLVARSRFPAEAGDPFDQGPHFATQANVALDTAGNLYYTWVDSRSRPMLAISRDGGEHWGRPMVVGPPRLALASLSAVDAGRKGAVAVGYMGLEQDPRTGKTSGWHGYLTISANALSSRPLFYTAPVNPRSDPLTGGPCGVIRCEGAGDFFDVAIGPDGTPWVSFVDACSPTCGAPQELRRGVAGVLVGGPKLR